MAETIRDPAFSDICECLPAEWRDILLKVPISIQNHLCEIRIRVNTPLMLTLGGKGVFLEPGGKICETYRPGLCMVTALQMKNKSFAAAGEKE